MRCKKSVLLSTVVSLGPAVTAAAVAAVTLTNTTASAAQTVTWATKASMPTARAHPGVAAANNGKLYAIGGYGSAGIISTVEEYDPGTNAWATKASMPTARYGVGVAPASNGSIYAIGGNFFSSPLTANEEYNPATDTWASKAPMPTARTAHGLVAASNGKLYAVGGLNNSTNQVLATVEEYDPATNAWATKASMPTARMGLALVAAANGKLYAMGGTPDATTGQPVLATVEAFDPATNVWTTETSMPTARWGTRGAVASNGKIYVVGGQVGSSYVATNEEATIGPATTSISTTLSVFDSVTLAGTTGTPTGSVTYNLYSGTSCTGTPVFSSAVTLDPDGTVPDSDVFTPTAMGTYNWQAVYSGDANNPGATSVCGSETVTFTSTQPAGAPAFRRP